MIRVASIRPSAPRAALRETRTDVERDHGPGNDLARPRRACGCDASREVERATPGWPFEPFPSCCPKTLGAILTDSVSILQQHHALTGTGSTGCAAPATRSRNQRLDQHTPRDTRPAHRGTGRRVHHGVTANSSGRWHRRAEQLSTTVTRRSRDRPELGGRRSPSGLTAFAERSAARVAAAPSRGSVAGGGDLDAEGRPALSRQLDRGRRRWRADHVVAGLRTASTSHQRACDRWRVVLGTFERGQPPLEHVTVGF